MIYTITSLSLRVSSAKRETSSIKSALVINPSFASCLWLNLHNLLKFQGLCASHGFGQCRFARATELFGEPVPLWMELAPVHGDTSNPLTIQAIGNSAEHQGNNDPDRHQLLRIGRFLGEKFAPCQQSHQRYKNRHPVSAESRRSPARQPEIDNHPHDRHQCFEGQFDRQVIPESEPKFRGTFSGYGKTRDMNDSIENEMRECHCRNHKKHTRAINFTQPGNQKSSDRRP